MFERLKNMRVSDLFNDFVYRLKRQLSRMTDRDLYTGYGISTDSDIRLPAPVSQAMIEAAQAKTSNLYRLRSDAGSFEIVGFITDNRGQPTPNYQLRHILTGITVKVSKNSMELMFERAENKSKEK